VTGSREMTWLRRRPPACRAPQRLVRVGVRCSVRVLLALAAMTFMTRWSAAVAADVEREYPRRTEPRRAKTIVFVSESDVDLWVAFTCHRRAQLRNPMLTLRAAPFLTYVREVCRSPEDAPALVLCDVDAQPRGFDLLARVAEARGRIPCFHVMVMSAAMAGSEGQAQARASGAEGFAVKPSTVDGYIRFFRRLPQLWQELSLRGGDEASPDFESLVPRL